VEAEEGTFLKVKGRGRDVGETRGERSLGRQRLHLKESLRDFKQDRKRSSVESLDAGAKDGMVLDEEREGLVQSGNVEGARQLESFRDVVGGRVGMKLLDEPHALLRGRKQQRRRGRPRRNGFGGAALETVKLFGQSFDGGESEEGREG
jgi:hypothetical protein